jgi:hypothetical protein
MNKHTPGPWVFYRQSSCDRGDSYGVKAPAPHYCVIPPLNIDPADARLIAAAPELLAALRAMLACCYDIEKDIETEDAVEAARAAIAKATGEKI